MKTKQNIRLLWLKARCTKRASPSWWILCSTTGTEATTPTYIGHFVKVNFKILPPLHGTICQYHNNAMEYK